VERLFGAFEPQEIRLTFVPACKKRGPFSMLSYARKIFDTKSFKVQPIATLCRAAGWVLVHVLPKREATIRVRVGDTSFRLQLPPVLKHFGSTGIFVQRQFYEPLLEFADRLVGKGDVVFDCGASQGIYSCAFGALVGASGHVYSFEPQAYAASALRRNARANGFDHVEVEQAAVSDKEGEAVLDTTIGSVSASIVRDFGRRSSVKVRTATLTSFAQRIGLDRLELIKMDIEGAEYMALKGAEPLITKYKPKIVLEASPGEKSWAAALELLNAHGYRSYLFDEEGALVPTATIKGDHPNVVFLPAPRQGSLEVK
jgi:FkbM family methyltransferase